MSDNTQTATNEDHDPEPLEPIYPPTQSDPIDKMRDVIGQANAAGRPNKIKVPEETWNAFMAMKPLPGLRPWKEAGFAALGLTAIVLGLWLVLSCFGCYSPDLSKTRYTCIAAAPLCPEGQACIDGCCGGGECRGMPMMSADMGGNTQQPDMTADLMPAPISIYTRGVAAPCKSRDGYRLENDVWACVGDFTGDPSAQCAQGYSPCMQNKATIGCDWLRTNTGGCFATAVRLAPYKEPVNTAAIGCGWNGHDDTISRGIAACGVCPTTAFLPICAGGFLRGVNCWEMTAPPSGSQTDFRCKPSNHLDSDYVSLYNRNPNWGIMCCPN